MNRHFWLKNNSRDIFANWRILITISKVYQVPVGYGFFWSDREIYPWGSLVVHWTAQTSWWGQEGWGYYKNKKQIIPSQPIHKLPDRVKGAGLLQKIKYTINSQPLHKLLMKLRGEWAQKMLIKHHNTAGESWTSIQPMNI